MQKSIWSFSKEELTAAVISSSNFRETAEKLGIQNLSGGQYQILKNKIVTSCVDVSHFKKSMPPGSTMPVPNSEIFVKNSTYKNMSKVKLKLIAMGMRYKCHICGLSAKWNGMPLVMRLDHINGINNDNRIENLRFVCPNCDSQLPTYAGKNVKRNEQKEPDEIIRERNRIYLKYQGVTKGIADWSISMSLPHYVIRERINYGWPVSRILTYPVESPKHRKNNSLTELLKDNNHNKVCKNS